MRTLPPRPDYATGEMLVADTFAASRDYLEAAQEIRNISLRTAGIVEGLNVTVRDDRSSVVVSPGMALDGSGQEIVVVRPQVVDLAEVFYPEIFLTVRHAQEYADWHAHGAYAGYTRLVETARLDTAATAPPGDADILLARLTFTRDRELLDPDLAGRRYCGLRIGTIRFPRPGLGPQNTPSLAIGAGVPGRPLVVGNSPSTDVFGSLRVDGHVSVRVTDPTGIVQRMTPATDSKTGLEVFSPPYQAGAGRISRRGSLVFGRDKADLSRLAPGDVILVDPDAPAPQQLEITQSTGRNAVVVRSPAGDPHGGDAAVATFDDKPYAVVLSAFRIRTGEASPALTVTSAGRVGIGASPGAVALTIGDGDLLMSSPPTGLPSVAGAANPRRIVFAAGGSVESVDGTHALVFSAPATAGAAATLSVREAGDIAFRDIDAATDAPALMRVTASSRVGIGFDAPGHRLTVNGGIRAWGLIFPDDSVQTTGVVPVPVGTVIDWVQPPRSPQRAPDGFQICDGSAITDPDSPMFGANTPDLRGKFVFGTIDKSKVGTTGGMDPHTHTVQPVAHTHALWHEHPVSGSTGNSTQIAGATFGSLVNLVFIVADHTHSMTLTSGPPDQQTSGPTSQTASGTTDPASNVPPYVDLLKIIRIK